MGSTISVDNITVSDYKGVEPAELTAARPGSNRYSRKFPSPGIHQGFIRYYGANAPRNLTVSALPWRHDRPCHSRPPRQAR